jgi:hypothetical protein
MDDPNINPLWDALLGTDTTGAVPRLLGLVAVFIALGGSVFWLLG